MRLPNCSRWNGLWMTRSTAAWSLWMVQFSRFSKTWELQKSLTPQPQVGFRKLGPILDRVRMTTRAVGSLLPLALCSQCRWKILVDPYSQTPMHFRFQEGTFERRSKSWTHSLNSLEILILSVHLLETQDVVAKEIPQNFEFELSALLFQITHRKPPSGMWLHLSRPARPYSI